MEIKYLDLLEQEIIRRFDGFHNGLVFGNFVDVRDLNLGDKNKYIVNGKTFLLPIERISVDVTDFINNNKYTVHEKANWSFLSLVWYIRKEVENLIDNHNVQSTLKDFKFAIKVIFDGDVYIDEKEDKYFLVTRLGYGIIHDDLKLFEI